MKQLFIALALMSLTACSGGGEEGVNADMVNNSASANGKNADELPDVKFDEEEFDFGRITQGENVSHEFYFTNTGKSDLIITGASGSCGCTVPEWPKEPIHPGEKSKINVVFHSEGKEGYQEKTVTVLTNCEPATRVVRIKTEVIVAQTAK